MNWNRVYDLVKKIPRGRVMTYGQVAKALRLAGWSAHRRTRHGGMSERSRSAVASRRGRGRQVAHP